MSQYTLEKTIDLAIQAAVQKAKKEAILECRPVGSYFITETEDDPNILFGGGEWQKLTGRYVLQCSDANHKAGTTIEAGLPDVKGGLCAVNWAEGTSLSNAYVYGACTQKAMEAATEFLDYGYDANKNCVRRVQVEFSASNSNSIYGKSDTVQPPARIVNVWKRVS